jgi:hypothetical protein
MNFSSTWHAKESTATWSGCLKPVGVLLTLCIGHGVDEGRGGFAGLRCLPLDLHA